MILIIGGEISIPLINTGHEPQCIEKYQRIVQMVIVPYIIPQLIESSDLSESIRGDGGFGSTGNK